MNGYQRMRSMSDGDRISSVLGDLTKRAMENGGAALDITTWREMGFKAMQATLDSEFGPQFRAMSPLPPRAQIVVDNAVVEVGQQRLTLVAAMLARGLKFTLTNPLSVTKVEYNKSNKVGSAQRTMTPESRGENKSPILTQASTPVYLTWDDFQIGIRELLQSQRVGMPLDTGLIKQTTRSVNEAIEDAAINGATTLDGQALQVDGSTAPGLLNAPDANTQACAAADWDATPDGANILEDIQGMIATENGDLFYGPFALIIGTQVALNISRDYSTLYPGVTIRDRIMKIPGISEIIVADMMPSNKIALVQLTEDVCDVIYGQPPTVIPWTSANGFRFFNMVMAIMVPRFKSNSDGASGVCIGTIA